MPNGSASLALTRTSQERSTSTTSVRDPARREPIPEKIATQPGDPLGVAAGIERRRADRPRRARRAGRCAASMSRWMPLLGSSRPIDGHQQRAAAERATHVGVSRPGREPGGVDGLRYDVQPRATRTAQAGGARLADRDRRGGERGGGGQRDAARARSSRCRAVRARSGRACADRRARSRGAASGCSSAARPRRAQRRRYGARPRAALRASRSASRTGWCRSPPRGGTTVGMCGSPSSAPARANSPGGQARVSWTPSVGEVRGEAEDAALGPPDAPARRTRRSRAADGQPSHALQHGDRVGGEPLDRPARPRRHRAGWRGSSARTGVRRRPGTPARRTAPARPGRPSR